MATVGRAREACSEVRFAASWSGCAAPQQLELRSRKRSSRRELAAAGTVALAVALGLALVALAMTTTPDTQQGRPPGDATCPRCSSTLVFCLYDEKNAMLACTKKECAFPLDTADVDALCLPATDSRVLAGDALAVLRQAGEESGRAPNSSAPLLSSLLAESPSCLLYTSPSPRD